jgi:tRNA nucleotidyltransferase (CCA-adding enzyme)
VRDWCRGITAVKDLDVTVEGDGIALARQLAQRLGATVTAHVPFGTATLRLPGGQGRLDVASCRKEVYKRPAAYPTVSAGTLEDDLFRRDFTVNAMALALNPGRFGTLIDPFHGAQDLRGKRLRILHERSFLDDPSRILRGVRFAQRFRLTWDRGTRRAALDALAAQALGWLNAGRLRREMERILDEPDPLACLRQLHGLLDASRKHR